MKKPVSLLILILFVFAAVGNLSAQSVSFGPRGGVFLEGSDAYAGVQIDIKPLPLFGLHLVPQIDYVFVEGDNTSQWMMGINALYDMVPLGLGSIYVGGGFTYVRTSFDIQASDILDDTLTDVSYNVIAGVKLNPVGFPMKPFANVRYYIPDEGDSGFAIEAGLHFSIF